MAEETHMHDIIIIGAGACGLAVAARLCESTPSALFTDSEHQRYHWMKASTASKRSSKPTRTSRRSNTAAGRLLRGSGVSGDLDIAVLDESGDQWISAWNEKFKRLSISYLRSPMFFHPDPRDRDGLLEYTYKEGREKELKEITGVVGKSLSKHQRKQKVKNNGKRQQETTYLDERDRNDYYRPSQSLFSHHCSEIISRYGLSNIVQNSTVQSITHDSDSSIFTLQTSTGTKKSRIVIFAAGAATKPSLPPDSLFQNIDTHATVTHAFSKSHSTILPPSLLTKIKQKRHTSTAVIGGGLTSAQITQSAISHGVSKVYHLIRGPLKVKNFDVDLSWVGKYKNFHLASFWSADADEELWEMMRDARGGGSVNPEYKKILTTLVKAGGVELREYTRVVGAEWIEEKSMWELETEPKGEGLRVDAVIYATGLQADLRSIESLKPLVEKAPIETVGGMPCLTNDLMWNEEMPFFFTGRLAGLRLGPAAGNLEGARQGAERIAWKIGELLKERKGSLDEGDSGYGSEERVEVDSRRLGLGFENQFGVLGFSDDE